MKRLCAFALSGVLCFSLLVGCGRAEESASLGEIKEVLLYDFEDYDRNFTLMKTMAYFGAVNINKDTEFVKNGKVSALIQPLGPYSTAQSTNGWGLQQNTCLYIPFVSKKYDFDYADCAKIQTINMSVYNAEKDNIKMYIGLLFDDQAEAMSLPVTFTLEPGWNEVAYALDHDVLAISNNLQTCYGMALRFDKVASRELKDAPKIYMDDIRLITTEKAVKPEKIQLLNEDGVCDFEQIAHKYVFSSSTHDAIHQADMSIVKAADYEITAPSGNNVLRAELKATDSIDGTIYERLIFNQVLAESLDFKNAGEDARFCFDLYNDSDVAIDFTVIFKMPKASSQTGDHLYASPKQWSKFSMPLAYLYRASGDDVVWYQDDTGQIEIHFGEFEGEDRVIYIDNLRIEK